MTLLIIASAAWLAVIVAIVWDIPVSASEPEMQTHQERRPDADQAHASDDKEESAWAIAAAIQTAYDDQKSQREQQRRHDRKTVWLSALTLVVVSVYTIVTLGLWQAQRQANRINDKSVTEANRAWVGIYRADHGPAAPRQPMYIQLTLVNYGREPALRGNWGIRIYAIDYIKKTSNSRTAEQPPGLSQNHVCDGVRLFPPGEGATIWPTLFHTPDPNDRNDVRLSAAEIPDTSESGAQDDIDAALTGSKSLILDACFVYWSGNQRRQTSARFLLRDQEGVSPSQWRFNLIPSGNSAD